MPLRTEILSMMNHLRWIWVKHGENKIKAIPTPTTSNLHPTQLSTTSSTATSLDTRCTTKSLTKQAMDSIVRRQGKQTTIISSEAPKIASQTTPTSAGPTSNIIKINNSRSREGGRTTGAIKVTDIGTIMETCRAILRETMQQKWLLSERVKDNIKA